MKNKILIALLLLVITIGIVSATDLDLTSIKTPDSYKVLDDDSFFSDTSKLEISIEEFELDDINDHDADDSASDTIENNPFANNTTINYTVVPGNIEFAFNFTDQTLNMYGCSELVEINGQKYSIRIWGNEGTPDEIIKKSSDCLEKINQLNNFEPLNTTQIIQ